MALHTPSGSAMTAALIASTRTTSRSRVTGGAATPATLLTVVGVLVLALARDAAAAAPPNDDLANAVAITPGLSGVAVPVSVDITDATVEPNEIEITLPGDPIPWAFSHSAWYTFTLPANAATMKVSAHAVRHRRQTAGGGGGNG